MAFQQKTVAHRTRQQSAFQKQSNELFENFKNQQAETAQKKQEKEAKKTALLALNEKEKKRECIAVERAFMMKGNSSEQIMLTDRPQRTFSTNIKVGDYVEVNSDLRPGKKVTVVLASSPKIIKI